MLDTMTTRSPAKASAPVPRKIPIENDTETARMETWISDRVKAAAAAPVVEVVTLTPVLASLLLLRNPENRSISETNLERMKKDIRAKRFDFNGQAIVVSEDGKLNDGQHRCRAVCDTGKTIRTVIVFGPPRASRFTLDQGVPRTVGHYLSMNGHTDANALASAAGHAWCYRNLGRLTQAGRDRPTKSECLLMVNHYRDLQDSLSFVSRSGVGAICVRSTLAFTHWAVARVGGEARANEFFDKLLTGAGLESGSPILYARNRLIQMKSDAKLNDKAEILFRAWNAWRRKERPERLSILGKKLPDLEK